MTDHKGTGGVGGLRSETAPGSSLLPCPVFGVFGRARLESHPLAGKWSPLLVDHNTEETIALCRQHGCWAGHTVYPVSKLTPERAVNIMDEHGIDRLMVNSSADWGRSDALSVAAVAVEMRKRGYTAEQVRRVVWENPIAFYQQSGRVFPGV